MNDVRGVLLDVYGTLVVDDDLLVADVSRRIAESVSAPTRPSAAEVADVWWRELVAACEGEGDAFVTQRAGERISLERTLAAFGSPLDPDELDAPLYEYWRAPDLFDDTRPFLAALAASGLPVALVSDIDRDDLEAALSWHGLAFEHVVTSEDVRAYKPRAAGFRAGLDLLGLGPADAADVVYVGNSWSSDVVGAAGAGIRPVWLNRTGRAPRPDGPQPWRTVTTLTEAAAAITG